MLLEMTDPMTHFAKKYGAKYVHISANISIKSSAQNSASQQYFSVDLSKIFALIVGWR